MKSKKMVPSHPLQDFHFRRLPNIPINLFLINKILTIIYHVVLLWNFIEVIDITLNLSSTIGHRTTNDFIIFFGSSINYIFGHFFLWKNDFIITNKYNFRLLSWFKRWISQLFIIIINAIIINT